ncbi:MAG: hypothetical protein ACXAC2_15020 [Candidatus Kariarchaeaceae archaeon]
MSAWAEFKRDLSQIKKDWLALDSTLRFLDVFTFLSMSIFGLAYFLIAFMEIRQSVSNVAFMIFPAVIGGYIFVLRVKLGNAETEEEKRKAKSEFVKLSSITAGLVFFTMIYGMLLA